MCSPKKRFEFQGIIWAAILLATIFLAASCQNDKKNRKLVPEVTLEERQWLGKFFDDLLFWENGAYTLWGSKPLTEIVLYHYTEEQRAEQIKSIPKEELENCYVIDQYDLPVNWEKWEKISSRFHLNRYLLFKSHSSEDGEVSFVYFVDILKTAAVIQDHYDLFSRAIGFDFHPL